MHMHFEKNINQGSNKFVMLKISIITVNFQNEIGFKKTIKSVISQDYTNFEFIIIDGGSKDGSRKQIELHSECINYWVSETDKGVYHAMNKGLHQASGDYCLFLNSGDYFYSNDVVSNVVKLIDQNAAIVYGLIEWEGNKLLWNPKRDLKDFEMTFQSLIPHQGTFFKTNILNSIGGYKENYSVVSDWAAMLEIVYKNYKTQKIDLIISICEEQGISSTFVKKILKERIHFLINLSFILFAKGLLFKLKQFLFN